MRIQLQMNNNKKKIKIKIKMNVETNMFQSLCKWNFILVKSVHVLLPVEAKQGDRNGETRISDHLNQAGQAFSSQTA